MPRYHVTLTDTEIQELKSLNPKGWKRLSYKACSNLTKSWIKSPKIVPGRMTVSKKHMALPIVQ